MNGKVTEELLKSKSGEFDIESIHTLSLQNHDIGDLGCIGECTALERLDLSKNDISALYALAGLTFLSHLDLSANRITGLDALRSLENLKSLNLAGNLIKSVDSLHCLSRLEKLEALRLKDPVKGLANPICMSVTYHNDVLKVLPKLITLDGERLVGKGSDVYKMISELDKTLSGELTSGNLNNVQKKGPWLPADYWKSSNEFDKSCLADADKQLQDLLEECQRVRTEADEKIRSVYGNT